MKYFRVYVRPTSIVYKIANARLSDAVNFSNLSLEYTFYDEIEDLPDCFVSKNSIAVLFSFSDPSGEMRFPDVYFHVFPSSKSF